MGSAASVDPGIAEIDNAADSRIAEMGSAQAMFCKWDLGREGAIRLDTLVKILTSVTDMSEEAIQLLFEHIDADFDGRIDYTEFSKWLFASVSASNSALLRECCCPDGHKFSVFVPEVDGWCCEECGDDLMIHQESLQCPECANLSWCIKCTLQQANVEIVEAFTLAAVRSTMATCVQLPAEMDTNAPTEGYARLSICSLAGSLCELEADLQWSVLQLKQAIESSTGIAECAQSLIFGVEALQDHNTLGTLQIPDGASSDCRSHLTFAASILQLPWRNMSPSRACSCHTFTIHI